MTLDEYIDGMMDTVFQQARARFGDAVKSQWFYAAEICPGCGNTVDLLKYKDENALSLNAFIHRERGVLIGYFLCSRCAEFIFRSAEKRPGQNTARHAVIESNLKRAYKRHLLSMDA